LRKIPNNNPQIPNKIQIIIINDQKNIYLRLPYNLIEKFNLIFCDFCNSILIIGIYLFFGFCYLEFENYLALC